MSDTAARTTEGIKPNLFMRKRIAHSGRAGFTEEKREGRVSGLSYENPIDKGLLKQRSCDGKRVEGRKILRVRFGPCFRPVEFGRADPSTSGSEWRCEFDSGPLRQRYS